MGVLGLILTGVGGLSVALAKGQGVRSRKVMKTPNESRARFGKELDSFVIEAVIELIWLILELALVVVASL